MQKIHIVNWFRKVLSWLDPKIIWSRVKRSAAFLKPDTQTRQPRTQATAGWKEKAMEDFKSWLTDLPDDMPAERQVGMDSCDLFTLLSEFTALRQEIKLQNREQNKSLRTHQSFIDSFQQAAKMFKERTQHLVELEEKIRQASELKIILPFLDIRDALVRGLEATRTMANSRQMFRRSLRGIEETVEEYEIALRRFDRALAQAGVIPIKTVGQPFDTATMRAVEKRSDPAKDADVVIEEHLGGFVRGDAVIRTAKVVLNLHDSQ